MPVPLIPIAASLIAEIVPDLLRLFKNDKAADVAEKVGDIAKQITGTSDAAEAAEMIKTDPALAAQFKQAMMTHDEEMEKLAIQREQLYVSDVQDARKYRDEKTFWLGVAVLITFALTVGLVLVGGYFIVVGSVTIDAALFAAISGMIGTIVGYVAANAQAVINYFFGSSHGSMKKSDDLSDAIKTFKK